MENSIMSYRKKISKVFALVIMLFFLISSSMAQVVVSKSYDINSIENKSDKSVLYSQVDLLGSGWASQDFEAPNDQYDCEGADDFIVPTGGWTISSIDAYGSGAASISLVNVFFYQDNSGSPAATSFESFMSVTATNDGTGILSFDLPSAVSLTPGHYWFSVQDASPYDPNGQWYWARTNSVYNTLANWRNPGDGFGTGATTWTPVDTALSGTSDFAFVLYSADAATIPISNMAIYLMLLLVGVVTIIQYRRKFA